MRDPGHRYNHQFCASVEHMSRELEFVPRSLKFIRTSARRSVMSKDPRFKLLLEVHADSNSGFAKIFE